MIIRDAYPEEKNFAMRLLGVDIDRIGKPEKAEGWSMLIPKHIKGDISEQEAKEYWLKWGAARIANAELAEISGVRAIKEYEPQYAGGQSELVNAVLIEIEAACAMGDMEAVDELLRFCPRINLIQYLDETAWDKFMTEEERDIIYNKGGMTPHIKKEWEAET